MLVTDVSGIKKREKNVQTILEVSFKKISLKNKLNTFYFLINLNID